MPAAAKVHCAHTELVDIDALIPNPRNPNTHPPKQIELLSKIIKHQGWRAPIVVSERSGFITKGHARLAAAKLGGWTQVPVDRQPYATEADEWADMVADNKIAELAETDDAILKLLAADLPGDFDFDLLGIPDFDITALGGGDHQDPRGEWNGMPEYEHDDLAPKRSAHRQLCGSE